MSDRQIVEGWIAAASQQGWTVRQAGSGGHIHLYPPSGGAPVSVSRTPDADDMKHQRSALLRAGLLITSNAARQRARANNINGQHDEEEVPPMREDSSPTVEVITGGKVPTVTRGDLMEGALKDALEMIEVMAEEHRALRARVEELEADIGRHVHPEYISAGQLSDQANTSARHGKEIAALAENHAALQAAVFARMNEVEQRVSKANPVEAFRASLQKPGR